MFTAWHVPWHVSLMYLPSDRCEIVHHCPLEVTWSWPKLAQTVALTNYHSLISFVICTNYIKLQWIQWIKKKDVPQQYQQFWCQCLSFFVLWYIFSGDHHEWFWDILSHAHINLSVTTELGQLGATLANQSKRCADWTTKWSTRNRLYTHLHTDSYRFIHIYTVWYGKKNYIYTVWYAFDQFDLYHNHLRLIVDIYPPQVANVLDPPHQYHWIN